jgi:hypothetical protein
MTVKFTVKKRMGEDSTQEGGSVTWNSRQPTAAAAIAEASVIMGVPESQLEAVAWGEIDWSGSGSITEV